MAFLNSPPFIYNKMQIGGKIKEWSEKDYYTMLAPLQQQGYAWDAKDARMRQMGPPILLANTPWCHAMSSPDKYCGLDHSVIFNNWQIITPRCMECWKIVVTPRTFDELVKLEAMQLQMGVPCKCGIEMRDYTPKFYGGYFYTGSLDIGRQRYKEVREAVDEFINPEIDVILKRACTEFEMVKGPSIFWKTSKDELRMIEDIEAMVDVARDQTGQHAFLKAATRMKWVIWAHMNGDMTYQKYNDGLPLWPDYVKFHDNDIDDIKHDLAVARGEAHGIKADDVHEYLTMTQDFAEKKGLKNTGDLVHALGSIHPNPLEMAKVSIKEVPEMAKGEHDELT